MMRTFCFSSTQLTVLVECDEQNLITKTAPVTAKFIGQHIKNLADWMRKHGGFEYTELKRISAKEAGDANLPGHRRAV